MTDKLTKAQRDVLEALANGHVMIFSRDGDAAWLQPTHPTGFLSDEQTITLRKRRLIHDVMDPEEEDSYGPSWHGEITDAGRAALSGARE